MRDLICCHKWVDVRKWIPYVDGGMVEETAYKFCDRCKVSWVDGLEPRVVLMRAE